MTITKQVAGQKMVEINSSQAEIGRVKLFDELPDTPAGQWIDESFARAYYKQPIISPPIQ